MGTGTNDSSRTPSPPKPKGKQTDKVGQGNITDYKEQADYIDDVDNGGGDVTSRDLNQSLSKWLSATIRSYHKDDIVTATCILVVICASCYVIAVMYNPELSLFPDNPKVDPQVFLQKIGKLPKLHPDLNQQSSFMFALEAFINRAEKSVVILCGENSSEIAAEVNKIAKSTGIAESEPLTVDMTVKRVNVQQLLVSKIRKSVRKYLLVTVLDIDQMSWDLPLALHAFGDLEIPDEKHILLVLSIKKKYLPEVQCDEFVQETLSEKWLQSGGNRDNIPPILSRIMDYTNCI